MNLCSGATFCAPPILSTKLVDMSRLVWWGSTGWLWPSWSGPWPLCLLSFKWISWLQRPGETSFGIGINIGAYEKGGLESFQATFLRFFMTLFSYWRNCCSSTLVIFAKEYGLFSSIVYSSTVVVSPVVISTRCNWPVLPSAMVWKI